MKTNRCKGDQGQNTSSESRVKLNRCKGGQGQKHFERDRRETKEGQQTSVLAEVVIRTSKLGPNFFNMIIKSHFGPSECIFQTSDWFQIWFQGVSCWEVVESEKLKKNFFFKIHNLTLCESIFKKYMRFGKSFFPSTIWFQPRRSSSNRLEVIKE